MKDAPRVYLAGPAVFLPDALAWIAQAKALCSRHRLTGISPLDALPDEPSAWASLPEWRRIALRNEAHIRSCQAVIANLTPFRGPSADVGTVYEVGFARALGLPVFSYATTATPFLRRTLEWTGVAARRDTGGSYWDADGLLIEQFDLFDNLMIEAAIVESGGAMVVEDCSAAGRWRDLAVFERCAVLAATHLLNT
jgi:nucleoside 2-deoxyribosyltransferase